MLWYLEVSLYDFFQLYSYLHVEYFKKENI